MSTPPRFNLSAWALRNRGLVLYAMIVLALVGAWSYLQLGQSEDPPFTFRAMVVRTAWPGATAEEVSRQVTERVEKAVMATGRYEFVRSYSRPGESQVILMARDSLPPDEVTRLWYDVRKKVGDLRHTLPGGVVGPFFNDEFGDTFGNIYALTGAGFALTFVGVVWATSSQASSRLGERVSHGAAFRFGTTVVLVGVAGIAVCVWLRSEGTGLPAVAPIATYVFASIGMGFAYPRTGVSMLASATDEDRGFNSSALTVADSLGAALALSVSGIAYAAAVRADLDPFPVVYGLAVVIGALGVFTGIRAVARPDHRRRSDASTRAGGA